MSYVNFPEQSAHFEHGILNAQALPDGLTPIYVEGQLFKIKDKKNNDQRLACAISLLNQTENRAGSDFNHLKAEKRIGVIHVEKGKIKSVTLSQDQLEMMQNYGVNEIAFKVHDTILVIKDQMILRAFTSESEYQQFTQRLNRA